MAVDTAPSALAALVRRAAEAGEAAGLDAIGVATAEPFAGTRRDLEERRAAGLHGGMQFTYRNPARSTDPRATLPSARALVAGARSYAGAPPEPVPGDRPQGRVARYAWGDHYAALREGLDAVAAVLRDEGWKAVVLVDQNNLVDRASAERAGLGWYGKSSLLLLPGAGSWFVLGSVLTDAPLAPAAPEAVADGCGACTRCVTACPTGAIVAPGVVDARRCLAWIVQAPGPVPREWREAMDDRIYGCDDCQDACPPNRVELRRHRRADPATSAVEEPEEPAGPADLTEPAVEEPDGSAWVDLLGLLAAEDTALLERHGRWYIAGRDPRWIRRNALVALGNAADPDDERVAAALRGVLAGDDDLLAAHAAWAARRLGRDDLLVALDPDAGPEVRVELASPAPSVRRPPDRPLGTPYLGPESPVVADTGPGSREGTG
ncbi:tRNA epoxyqueuosine(34) reductase QueG [Iamia sp.]|uniref:tRNA epoxyqueuosine(34) reductase QueG n=1 Tax=Iamia sp. TaxID=2722710 RepID=UPI002B643C62|nr:tRNA epoxyqueuosine(34) reductase QueG [Iamia sp.]HXH59034.1 tRNA epoxyqueuosine(34) reductase QueG [Iamia sp.]